MRGTQEEMTLTSAALYKLSVQLQSPTNMHRLDMININLQVWNFKQTVMFVISLGFGLKVLILEGLFYYFELQLI